jgi:4-amino-4-deoxy-L-arabinose transferase-like glycosyltransferase
VTVGRGLFVVALAGAVAVRCYSPSDLWLDEALSVDIARLPVLRLLTALRHDGSPPLYYLLLHGWMWLFGSSDAAVRLLSSLVSVATLPCAWLLGRRILGPRGAVTATLVVASSPFALRYATEGRMYALLLLEALAGGIALEAALRRPSRWPAFAGVAACTAALAYTHYWALFLLAVVGGWLGWHALLHKPRSDPHRRVLLAVAAAGVLFLPQVPTLVYQLRHTGTPWAASPQPRAVFDTLIGWAGPGSHVLAVPLGFGLLLLALVGWLTQPGAQGLVVRWRGDATGRLLAGLSFGPLVLAVLAAIGTGSGYVVRYTAVALPAYLLLVARGLTRLPPKAWAVVLALVTVAGLQTGRYDATRQRTEAGVIAQTLASVTQPGDLVVYCPDQLSPAVHRLLVPGRVEVSAGDPLGPARVDWVDYGTRNGALDAGDLAVAMDRQAGAAHTIALVWADGYRTWGDTCGQLAADLAVLRPLTSSPVGRDPGRAENAAVGVYLPTPAGYAPAAPAPVPGSTPREP